MDIPNAELTALSTDTSFAMPAVLNVYIVKVAVSIWSHVNQAAFL